MDDIDRAYSVHGRKVNARFWLKPLEGKHSD
jgi:hypothetical protein